MSQRAERRFTTAVILSLLSSLPAVASAETIDPPLVLDAKIPLGEVNGRIDHLGVDLNRRRLFVVELGNDTLGVVDLAAGRTTNTIGGFTEPQGVAHVPFADSVYVANGGDGSVRVLRGEDLASNGRIDLGSDADNIRVDVQRQRVLVGYGKGALAIIDPASRTKTGDIRLKAHPEGFQIDDVGSRVFVNLPDAHEIAVADLAARTADGSWPTQGLRSNFPMAIDRDAHRALVVFRSPSVLMAFAAEDGRAVAKLETCGDGDDLFVDAKRHHVYVSCGEGAVDILGQDGTGYRRIARIPTVAGARTSLFVPELDRLFVAVRASSGERPAIWVFRPTP
jgi:DNA-binding beta-propeller fold protein YncE